MPQLLKPEPPRAHAPQQEKPPQWEAYIATRKSPPLTAATEKPVSNNKNSVQPKINQLIIFLKRMITWSCGGNHFHLPSPQPKYPCLSSSFIYLFFYPPVLNVCLFSVLKEPLRWFGHLFHIENHKLDSLSSLPPWCSGQVRLTAVLPAVVRTASQKQVRARPGSGGIVTSTAEWKKPQYQ